MSSFLNALKHHRLHDSNAWLGRLIIWSAAVAAGLMVTLFTTLTEYSAHLFAQLQHTYTWAPLLVTPLGGMIIVALCRKWFNGSEGSGIPQTIAALEATSKTGEVSRFLSLKIALAKIVLSSLSLAAGFSCGREGPSIQVSASIMHAFRYGLAARFSSISARHLIIAGGAAGIAAAFNTPLAGIVFAFEELNRNIEHKTNRVIILSVILAGLVSISLKGNTIYFGHLSISDLHHTHLFSVLLCGSVCGISGGIFARLLSSAVYVEKGKPGYWRAHHPIAWAGACGLVVALLGICTDGAIHGSGDAVTRSMLSGTHQFSWYYTPAKALATLASYFSGIPGGIFAPSLAIGAGIGNYLLHAPYIQQMPHTLPAIIYALCMVGFLSAVTQEPLTSMIIMMEMIDGHRIIIALMAVALIASLISRLFSPPIFAVLAAKQLEKIGITHYSHHNGA